MPYRIELRASSRRWLVERKSMTVNRAAPIAATTASNLYPLATIEETVKTVPRIEGR